MLKTRKKYRWAIVFSQYARHHTNDARQVFFHPLPQSLQHLLFRTHNTFYISRQCRCYVCRSLFSFSNTFACVRAISLRVSRNSAKASMRQLIRPAALILAAE